MLSKGHPTKPIADAAEEIARIYGIHTNSQVIAHVILKHLSTADCQPGEAARRAFEQIDAQPPTGRQKP